MAQISPAMSHLTPAERSFVREYSNTLIDQANRAYEPLQNLLERPIPNSHVVDSKGMLERPLVQVAIYDLIRVASERKDLTPERIIREYMAIAFSNLKDYWGESAVTLEKELVIENLTDEQWSAVQEVKIDYDRLTGNRKQISIKMYNKMEALGRLSELTNVAEYLARETITDTAPEIAEGTSPIDVADTYARMIEHD